MKTTIQNLLAAAIFIAASLQTHAQGMIYDQQSATGPKSPPADDFLNIQEDSPLMQSFIPTLSTIDFVQFQFWDIANNGNNGATVFVNLWEGSPDTYLATLLGATTPTYMPNGFVNDGLGYAGITNFYFSTPIALTVGLTYYLQPVVLSSFNGVASDNPWDIATIGNTYPNGQLFEDGFPFENPIDFWFREGVVPEPSALALIGLSGLLAFAFKRRSKLVVLLLLAALVLPVLSVQAGQDSVVQIVADESGITPVSATTLPNTGTFWIMTNNPNGNLIALPYPFLPSGLSTLPAYSIGNAFIIDDTGSKITSSAGRMSSAQATSAVQMQAQTMENLIEQIETFDLNPTNESGTNGGYQSYGFTANFDTNGLYLEASNEDTTLALRLMNSIGGDNYQLLSAFSLSGTNWNLGQITNGSYDGYTDFTPVSKTNALTFFKVHHANPIMQIYDSEDSEELNPTNSDPGHPGSFYIQDNGWATNDISVFYSISGTAQGGIDYSNLTGEIVVPVSQGGAEIDIEPIYDGLKPNQTVILTLLQNTNFLVDPSMCSATNILKANPQVYPIANGDNEPPMCPNMTNNINLASSVINPRGLPLTYTILTWPTYGTLNTNDISNANVTYTPTNCYEGPDSFTFEVSDGQYTSLPANVNLTITNQLYANAVYAQTCRGGSVYFTLDGGDYCSTPYYVVAAPSDGTVTNVPGQPTIYAYTSTNTTFTGTNTFNYVVSDDCGDSVTNTVTITVGDAMLSLYPGGQSLLTKTNQPVTIPLSVLDGDTCHEDTNYYTYTISGPAHGTLSGTPPNFTYTPGTDYEGTDFVQLAVSDGAWTSSVASVTLYVIAGPMLYIECDPFGAAVQLEWNLDDTVNNMVAQDGLTISDFIIYRSAVSGSNYTAIATNYDAAETSYLDTNAVFGQTNYYVVNFEPSLTGTTYESPLSNEAAAVGLYPDDLIPPDAVWDVVTNQDDPTNVVELRAPFSSYYTNQYPGIYPLPNTYWPPATNGVDSIWTNHITLYIPTNVVLSQVQYSIAIDNDYQLYLNNSTNPIDSESHEDDATWPSFKSFDSVATNILHWGTNDIGVVIQDRGGIDYFSMVVTTNTCGR